MAPYKFSPATLTIAVGDSVKVTDNDRTVPHTFTGSGFDSGNMNSGATYTYRFTKAGKFHFVCTYHDSSFNMNGDITVTS